MELRHKMTLAAVTLAATPFAVFQSVNTGSNSLLALGALASMFAGIVVVLAVVEVMRTKW